MEKAAEIFEKYRRELFNLAYGMLGRKSEAEDVVQDAYLKWTGVDIDNVEHNKAYLSTIVSRLCLDELKSARRRREQYIGPDLPEPIISGSQSPQEELHLEDSLSIAVTFLIQKLNPIQRAVFILREVFKYPYSEIAEILEKSEPNCRKIAQRARDHINYDSDRFKIDPHTHKKLLNSFIKAVKQQDITQLENLLAEDAVLYSDGGGKVTAARKPVYGKDNIARFLLGISQKTPSDIEISISTVNGEPGILIYFGNQLQSVWSFHAEQSGLKKIFAVLNPDKLSQLSAD